MATTTTRFGLSLPALTDTADISVITNDLSTLDSKATLNSGDTVTGAFLFSLAAVSNLGVRTQVTGDTNDRLNIGADGKVSWGPGNAAADISLYRSGVGAVTISGSLASSILQAISSSATSVPSIVKGFASQTADLQQWQKSDTSILARIDPYGTAFVSSVSTTNGINIATGSPTPANVASILGSGNGTNVSLVVKGSPSQTADLQGWQNSTGVSLAKISSTGVVRAEAGLYVLGSNGGIDGGAPLAKFEAAAASHIPIVSKGFSGQTADLTQWQNSAGVTLAKVDSGGSGIFVNLSMTGKMASTLTLQSGQRVDDTETHRIMSY